MFRLLLFVFILFGAAASHAADAKVQRAVPYSDAGGERNSLDIYSSSSGKEQPVVVWIHGGGWRRGDKCAVGSKPEAFNAKGMALVSINYRLHPDADYKTQGADVAKAIHWVHDHAKEFGGSDDRIYLMGHSAGAHLAALVATDHRYLEAEGLKLDAIKGVILLDGAGYDIPRQIELAPLRRMKQLYTTVFSEDAEKQKEASPITHVAKGKSIPPFLILHVARRRDGKAQSESLGAKLREVGGEAKVVAAEDKTHATINRELGGEDDLPTKEVFEFLDARGKALK